MCVSFIAQAVDLLDKKKGGPDVKYPLVVYAILSTGQRYLVFTVAYYTAEAEKPVLLYHGLESLHVLPYLGSIEDPNNSGLLVGKKVNRDEVERVMATISVCLHGSIDISCNF